MIEIEVGIQFADNTPDEWINDVEEWRGYGATHFRVNTMGAGITSPNGHIEAIRRFWEVVSRVSG